MFNDLSDQLNLFFRGNDVRIESDVNCNWITINGDMIYGSAVVLRRYLDSEVEFNDVVNLISRSNLRDVTINLHSNLLTRSFRKYDKPNLMETHFGNHIYNNEDVYPCLLFEYSGDFDQPITFDRNILVDNETNTYPEIKVTPIMIIEREFQHLLFNNGNDFLNRNDIRKVRLKK